MEINVVDTCPKCRGTRCEIGTKAVRCVYCQGSGYETTTTGKPNIDTGRVFIEIYSYKVLNLGIILA